MAMLGAAHLNGVGKRLLNSMPPMIPCAQGSGYNLPRVAVSQIKQGHGFTAANVHDENIRLKAQCTELKAQVSALKLTLFEAKAVSEDAEGGLAKLKAKRGPKITLPSKIRAARMAAAGAVLQLSTLIQGQDDLVLNALDLLKVAAAKEPAILARLAAEGLLVERLEVVADNRYTQHDCKRTRVAAVVSTKNAFLFQAGSRASHDTLHQLRRLGGKALIQTPEQLQAWAAVHPDLPAMKFVLPGSSAVWTPPSELLPKLFANPRFKASLRTTAPYDRLHFARKRLCWYLVSATLCESPCVTANHVVCRLVNNKLDDTSTYLKLFLFYFIRVTEQTSMARVVFLYFTKRLDSLSK
jgi:hypothetical protein